MRCPYCGERDSRVVDSRELENSIRRRRECPQCDHRFTTYEHATSVTLAVVKKDGRREDFDRKKLERGIRAACFKRPIPVDEVNRVIGTIETELFQLGKSEVSSELIGELAMQHLRSIDGVAYVRFASVYRQFRDIDHIVEEIDSLRAWRRRLSETQDQLSFRFEEDQPCWS
jgi:transcriptional repressor NrdR